jgi:aldose 1-epimerase
MTPSSIRGGGGSSSEGDDAPVDRMGQDPRVMTTRDDGLTLGEAGELEATFAPGAGMVGCSLRHRGEELLGLRGGLSAYVEQLKTFGIPLLYPWANRLSQRRFSVAGRELVIDPARVPVRLEESGLPIHGLLAAARGWTVERHVATGDGAILCASFDWAAHEALLAAYPFPHGLRFEAALSGGTLTIVTTVEAAAGAPVPIAFGYHPYLRLPGVARADWRVELPVREQLELDERTLPTGRRAPVEPFRGALGTRTFDDAYVAPPRGAPFVLAGGGRRIELAFGGGYGYSQVYAPADDDVIAFEPMTAPANALVDGPPALRVLAPGETYAAAFSITVGAGPD